MIDVGRLSMLSSAFPEGELVTPTGMLACSLDNVISRGSGSSVPPVASELKWIVASPAETTWTRVGRKISPTATPAQISALASANGYAYTTAVRPGYLVLYTTDIFPDGS